jgi:hypothetical protein
MRIQSATCLAVGSSGRKGAFESPSLIRKRNQTNQLQTKLLTSGPGSRRLRFKSSLPDQSFLESINYEYERPDFRASIGRSALHLSNELSIFNQ